MQTLEALQSKIKSVEDLRAVVRTMKTLAMVNIRQYEKARSALKDYSKSIELGLQALLRDRYFSQTPVTFMPNSQKLNQGRVGVILFGSDHGLCGQFNEQIVTYALEQLNERQIHRERRLIATVGVRLIPDLEAAKQTIENHFSLPSSVAGTTQLVQELLFTIEKWRFRQFPQFISSIGSEPIEETYYPVEQIILFYNRSISTTNYQPLTLQLLPLNLHWLHELEQRPWNSSALPIKNMNWERLFPLFIRQYLFVSLYQATVESMASENASRFASMQAAEKNIEERLTDLNADYRSSRQNSITAELLDIVAGFEALNQPD
ncbi:F0F1 ATP synthase subunit gamma [Fischerella thermalis CCMEE 5330]|uniref:F0F1 ATP synthase subunit gamma n=1 Tax=Fischerella thermalis CCMEE 5330 TaxID=2019670 RepID=A0A2N6MI03_9CYAN|nr:F0F1 ATP synthase subunit gamma [Fischerella thermalis]PMB46368.1 F0F1 ATP synthase subunit gamma [Fischerella thermalis CCMEE 5330]